MTNFRLLCRGVLLPRSIHLVAHRPAGRLARAAKFPFLLEMSKGRDGASLLPDAISSRRATRFHTSSRIHGVLETRRAGSTFPDRPHKCPKRRERRSGPAVHRRISGARTRRWIRRLKEDLCGEAFPWTAAISCARRAKA